LTIEKQKKQRNLPAGVFRSDVVGTCSDKLILHADVDAFFASVEQLLIPSLRDRAVIVGSGCIASCSYEARRFGLHAGMSLRSAKRLCPSAVVLEGRYPIYRCFAEHVWCVCRRYTCGLETYLDEAYGDASGMAGLHGDPPALGRRLQRQVHDEVGLWVSVGLAANRMLAKLASGSAKPKGVAWIRPGQEQDVLGPLAIEDLPGVGRKTAERLRDVNVQTVGQLRLLPRAVLRCMFGRRGEVLYDRCRGRDAGQPADLRIRGGAGRTTRPKLPGTISRETTFGRPQCDPAQIRAMLSYLTERAMRAARERRLKAGRVELSIRYADWKQYPASRTLERPTSADDEVFKVVLELLGRLHRRRVALRHVGVVLSKFSRAADQPVLFRPPQRAWPDELYEVVDAIRDRWGHAAVVKGQSIDLLGKLEQNDYGFVLRTPSLTK